MQLFTGFLKISTLSVALLASTAITATVIMSDAAYAGNGNGNGNGGDKGNNGKSGSASDNGKGKSGKSNGNSAKSDNNQKTSKAKGSTNPLKAIGNLFKKKDADPKPKRATSSKTTKKTRSKAVNASAVTSASAPPKPRGNALARTLGVHPSELGALNAANASPNALANASPNSRVGKLAIYASLVEATRVLQADLAAAEELLSTLDAPERSQDEIDLALADAEIAQQSAQDELAGLIAAQEEAGGEDEAIAAEIEAVTTELDDLNTEIVDLVQERLDGEAFETAQQEVEALETELSTQSETQRSALEAAANKDVTDAVEAAVQALLGIDQEPLAVEDDEVSGEDIVALD